MNQKRPFKVGLTRDFLTPDGQLTYHDIGLSILDEEPNLEYFFFDTHHSPVEASQLRECDAVISLAPQYTPQSFAGADDLLAVVRCGVGYDMVDVGACTDNDVLLTITAGAVNHSVGEAIIGWMLMLSHRMQEKDHLVRQGGWAERSHFMGTELREKTLGVVGLGGIGRRLVEMLQCFGMNTPLVYDPFLTSEQAGELGVQMASLDELMKKSDFVSVNCPLNDNTRGLIDGALLSLMKPTAYLINTARGGIVDEPSLVEMLREKRIAGAATDVFAQEPVPPDNPLLQLDNVILAPHCIAWTHELFRDMGRMACRQVVSLARGQVPEGVINREVPDRSGFQAKLARFAGKGGEPPANFLAPLASRPQGMQPDRSEVINEVAAAAEIEIAPGVTFRPLVGEHNRARSFTTGVVSLSPGIQLPYHLHTFSESITLLAGEATLDVEDRRYILNPLDNAVVPPGVAHSVTNTSSRESALLHIALASETPTRELVDRCFEIRRMGENSAGHPGKERINRHRTTPTYEANPGAKFQDWFNLDLGCHEMSGGYGLFQPGAQLPCHIHDFDESITIVQGAATCMVEGRKYRLSDNATALVPRGRCHYFINDSDAPMAMIWVYAGPTPDRIVMQAALCDLPG